VDYILIIPEHKKTAPLVLPNVQLVTQAYLDNSTSLVLTVYSSAAVTVNVIGEYYNQRDSAIGDFSEVLIHPGDRSKKQVKVTLAAGYLMSCRVFLSTGTAGRGQCWCVCELQKYGTQFSQTILTGYALTGSSLSYPLTPITEPTQGKGANLIIQPGNPAAGTGLLYNVPLNVIYRLYAFSFNLTCGVGGGNRRVIITHQTATPDLITNSPGEYSQAAGAGIDYFFSERSYIHTNMIASFAFAFEEYKPDYLIATDQLVVTAENLGVTDQLQNFTFAVEQWINP
jgi:hypothetical protein